MVRFIRLGRVNQAKSDIAGFLKIGSKISSGRRGGRPFPGILLVVIASALFTAHFQVHGQEFQTSVYGHAALGYQLDDQNVYEPGFNGVGFCFDRIQTLDSTRFSIINGFEYSIIGWGSQILMNNGFGLQIFSKKKFSAKATFSALNGIILFRPKPLYTGAFDLGAQFYYTLKQNTSLFLKVGFRYSLSPGYRDYGPIWSYSDVPVGIGFLCQLSS